MANSNDANIEMADVRIEKNKTHEGCEQKEKSPKKKEIAMELISTMSVSGLNRMASSTNMKIRFFWGALFVLGCIGFTYNLIAITNQFIQAPLLTQTNYEYKIFTWPVVTFCNPTNPIAFSKIKGSKEKWRDLLKRGKRYKLPDYVLSSDDIAMSPHYLAMFSLSAFDFFNVSVEDTLIISMRLITRQETIAASAGEFDKFFKVERKYLKTLFVQRLGSTRFPLTCFSLDLGHLNIIKGIPDASDTEGVKLTLKMDDDSYRFFNYGYERRKLKMFFTNSNTTLNMASIHKIYPGTEIEVRITERFLHRIRDCHGHQYPVEIYDPYYDEAYAYDAGYEDCRLHLSQKAYFERCKCYNPFLPVYKLSSEMPNLCLNMSIYKEEAQLLENLYCMNNLTMEYMNSSSFQAKLRETCNLYLYPNCKSTSYSYYENTFGWETQDDMNSKRLNRTQDQLRHILKNRPDVNATVKYFEQNMASVKLMRSSKMVVGAIEEYEYPFSQFMSDVGGILGLWLGFSIIGFFEIVELFIILCSTK